MEIGDTLLNGQVIILNVDTQGRILSVKLPAVRDPVTNEPQVITFQFGYAAALVEAIVAPILAAA